MDSLKQSTDTINIYDIATDFLLHNLFSLETLNVFLFVLLVVSVFRLFTPNLNNAHYKWATLIVSFIGTLLIKEFGLNKKFVYDFTITLCISVLGYTYLGKTVLNKGIEWLQKKLGMLPDTVTQIDTVKDTPTQVIEQSTTITDKPKSNQ